MSSCAIMQPTYFPWIGYFDLIDQVDVFVFYDDVQLVKRSWGTRNRIKTSNGEHFLTIPVVKSEHRDQALYSNALIADSDNWRQKHLKSIIHSYSKSKYFDTVFPFVEQLILAEHNYLSEFNMNIISQISLKIGLDSFFVKSSDIGGDGNKDERLVSICESIKAKTYLSPQGSAAYIDSKNKGGSFAFVPIDLVYHNYEHPKYHQLYGEFISHMNILDVLFNCGFNLAQLVRSGRRPSIPFDQL